MRRKIPIAAVMVGLVLGCGQRRQPVETMLTEKNHEYLVTILLDMSGSFQHFMWEDGKAYKFALQVIDKYFRDRIGENDQLVIAQISGVERALLWQGTPQQLRRDFPSASAFRTFLIKKSNPNASFVHEAVARTLDYMVNDPAMASGKTKCGLLVLSDMEDTGEKTEELKKRITTSLKDFGTAGGIVGLYYVNPDLVSKWRNVLRDSEIKSYCVEPDFVSRPELPSFEN
jgi:hypothetical protein